MNKADHTSIVASAELEWWDAHPEVKHITTKEGTKMTRIMNRKLRVRSLEWGYRAFLQSRDEPLLRMTVEDALDEWLRDR